MALFRKIRRLPYNIVSSILNLGYKCRTLLVRRDDNMVANSHGVSGANPFQSEVTLNLAVYVLSILRLYGVPTASVLYY